MGRCIKPIGGEFWFDNSIIDSAGDNFKDTKGIFLGGGQCAIQFIIEDIQFNNDEYVLVPSYLCPTILYNFAREHVNYIFYEVNENLAINLDDLEKKIEKYKVKAVFYIDYFGFFHQNDTLEFLKQIQKRGILLIEDAVQMLWFNRNSKFIGNYIFNSYRKFLPVDGSVVFCTKSNNYPSVKDDYYKLMNEARIKKTAYIEKKEFSEDEFLKLFRQAEEAYYERKIVYGMDKEAWTFLNNVNFELVGRVRIDNYNYLFDKLSCLKNIKTIFDKNLISKNVPLGMPVVLMNRDELKKEMAQNSMYCPIHWNIGKEDWARNYPKSLYLSSHILTLPIDHRYDKEDLNRVVSIVKKFTGNMEEI